MCGIAGILGNHPSQDVLQTMLKAQEHRGPDATGVHTFSKAVLGHNRLTIIDHSENANQPFVSKDGRYTLVFNGEIYNYIELKKELSNTYNFSTASDTEVLLAAYIKWGKDCLEKCNGMFSFSIWDTQTETLFAARDRFGVKPFYYTNFNGHFYFASEIKTLFAAQVPQKMNKTVWANYLAFGSYGMPDETFWANIHQLPAGHFLTYKNDTVSITQWYDFVVAIKKQPQLETKQEIIETYTALLKNSIQLRFRADVPVGINLSGGLDSSALLTFVKLTQDSAQCNAYTFYTGDERYDELPWVEQMIQYSQCPLHTVQLKASSVTPGMEKVAWSQDEPYGGVPTIAYAQLFKAARDKGTIVLLDGQGMDEQWAGYDYYSKLLEDDTKQIATIQGVKQSPFRVNVLSEDIQKHAVKPEYPKPFNDALLDIQYRDLFYTKIPRALRFNDRVSMAASTELREPFLDYRLVEFAFAQKEEFKIKNGFTKYILRSIVSEHLSENITLAPKRPLQTPQREWLGNDLKQVVEKKIDSLKESTVKNWFNIPILEEELANYFKGEQDSSFHIWQWINLAMIVASQNEQNE